MPQEKSRHWLLMYTYSNLENTKKKWNSIIWASCLGHYKIAKLLILKGALQNYLEAKIENRLVALGSNK